LKANLAFSDKKRLTEEEGQRSASLPRFPTGGFLDHSVSLQKQILAKSEFLECLRIEKRRVDRSKESLSIVLFSLDPKKGGDGKKDRQREIWEFLKDLNKITRETDIKGWLSENSIGVLLPNTDKMGADFYVKKIFQGNGQPYYSVTRGTYPDHVFEKLLAEEKAEPDFFPLDLDEELRPFQLQRAIKRGIDIIGSLGGLILLSPLILFLALVVKSNSPGPVIYKQTRLGRKGRRFTFYKIRSMYWKADEETHRQYVSDLIQGRLEKNPQGGPAPFFKMQKDERITPVGKILRQLSLDELPQLYNVLKGDMSLVGPRPPLAYEVENYQPWHLRRILEVKPGLTGLWQVTGRSATTFNEMVRLDLRYVKAWSLWLDLKILTKTLKAVLYSREAA
jgi:lipopolysaccharide/colanic/teichoic acid biosynthesis glycosyltransferase